MPNPLYLVADPTTAHPSTTDKLYYMAPGIDTGDRWSRGKFVPFSEKRGARLVACSTQFALSAGYPKRYSSGTALRRATDADAARVEELTRQLAQVQVELRQAKKTAWDNGSAPHVTEAYNFPFPTES